MKLHKNVICSLHFNVALNGGTVVRPLFFEFPGDAEAHNRGEEFLWGDSMLIAPVYTKVTLNEFCSEYFFASFSWLNFNLFSISEILRSLLKMFVVDYLLIALFVTQHKISLFFEQQIFRM